MQKQKRLKSKKTISHLPVTKSTSGKSNIILGFLIFCIGFLIYANTINYGYVLDDLSVIKENYLVKQGTEGLTTILTTNYRYGYWNSAAVMYRPMSLLMFAIEWEISPNNPQLHHFINVLLYALTGLILFFVFVKIFRINGLFPFLASLLFITHPIHTEVVANIKSRDEILVLFFGLFSIYMLLKYLEVNKLRWIIASFLSFTLALFSKENAVTFLAMIPLTIYFSQKTFSKKHSLLVFSYVIPTLLFLVVRTSVISNNEAGDISVIDNYLIAAPDLFIQKLTAISLLGKYFYTLLLPYQLCHDYGYNQLPLVSLLDWRTLLSFALIILLIAYAIKHFKSKNVLVFAILFLGISFSTCSNLLIVIGSSFGERFLYIPSIGFVIFLTYSILYFCKLDLNQEHSNVLQLFRANVIPVSIILVIAFLYSCKTISRNKAWESSFTLYDTDIKTSPNSAKLQYHYGLELVKKGLTAETRQDNQKWMSKAMKAFKTAIKILPAYHDAYGQLGLAYFRKGDLVNAKKNYQLALKYKQVNPNVYSNLGTIYYQQGKLDEAIESYKKAIYYNPRFVDAHRNLGSVYGRKKQFDNAIKHFQEALQFKPKDPTVTYFLYLTYRDSNDKVNREKYWKLAKQLNPNIKR